MKKLLVLGVAAILMFVAAPAASAGVHGAGHKPRSWTFVTGVITDGGDAIKGAKVIVTCNSKTATDWTGKHGAYLVKFNGKKCPDGSTVNVAAAKGDKTGASTGTVSGVTTRLNLAVVNVAVPEFGVVGATAAGALGLGAFAVMRRRQAMQQA